MGDFLSDHGKHDDLANLLGFQTLAILGTGLVAIRDARLRLLQQFREIFGDRGESGIAQEVGETPTAWVATSCPPSSRRNHAARTLVSCCNSSTADCTMLPYCCALTMFPVSTCTTASLFARVRAWSNTTSSIDTPSAISAAKNAAAGTRSVKGAQARCSVGRQRASSHAEGSQRPRRARSRAIEAVKQNDAIADFHRHAHGQGIGPQQHSGAGKSHQDGRDHRQRNDQIAGARVDQNRAGEQVPRPA